MRRRIDDAAGAGKQTPAVRRAVPLAVARDFLLTLERMLLPPGCLHCTKEESGAPIRGLCGECSAAIEIADDESDAVSFAWPMLIVGARYHGPVTVLVHQLKYGLRPSAAVPLASLLGRAILHRQAGERLDALVPVPTHFLKRWTRGLDPAKEIAAELGGELGVPVIHNALYRRRPTVAQGQARSNSERRSQVMGCFAVRRGIAASLFAPGAWRPFSGLRLGLVDDVVTSGATLMECSLELCRAGAAQVIPLAAASAAVSFRRAALP